MANDAYIPDAQQIVYLDYLFGGGSLSIPASYDLALYNGDPLVSGTEASGSGYGRIEIANDSSHFAATADGLKTNAALIDWGAPSGGTWPALWMAVYAHGGSTMLHVLARNDSASGTVADGQPFQIKAGKLSLRWYAEGTTPPLDETWFSTFWDAVYGGGSFSPPTELELALFVGDPRDGGVEVDTDAGYERLVYANDSSLWTTGALTKASAIQLDWPASGTLTGTAGRVSHVVVYDHDTAQRVAILPRPDGPAYMAAGDKISIAAGGLQFNFIQHR